MEVAIEAGAEDVVRDEDVFEITCEPTAYDEVRKGLEAGGITTKTAEITKIPGTTVAVDAADGEKILKMMDAFEENEDVQHVHSNFELPEEVLKQL